MAVELRWRKAFAVSIVLHCIVLTGLGWMAAQAFVATETQENFIELDLVGMEEAQNAAGGSGAANPEMAAAVPAPPVKTAMPEVPLPPEKEVQSSADVADNDLPVVAGNADSAQGSGGSDLSSGSGTGGGSDGAGLGTAEAGEAGGRGRISPPGILARVEPSYPESARQAGLQGTVVLKIEILENGRPGEVTVHQSSGHELLDDAAVSAVKRWRFVPAKERDSGQTVPCYTTMPVVFKLRS
jgi:protein TonB